MIDEDGMYGYEEEKTQDISKPVDSQGYPEESKHYRDTEGSDSFTPQAKAKKATLPHLQNRRFYPNVTQIPQNSPYFQLFSQMMVPIKFTTARRAEVIR